MLKRLARSELWTDMEPAEPRAIQVHFGELLLHKEALQIHFNKVFIKLFSALWSFRSFGLEQTNVQIFAYIYFHLENLYSIHPYSIQNPRWRCI